MDCRFPLPLLVAVISLGLTACKPDLDCSGGKAKHLLGEMVAKNNYDVAAPIEYWNWKDAPSEVENIRTTKVDDLATMCAADIAFALEGVNDNKNMHAIFKYATQYKISSTDSGNIYMELIDVQKE